MQKHLWSFWLSLKVSHLEDDKVKFNSVKAQFKNFMITYWYLFDNKVEMTKKYIAFNRKPREEKDEIEQNWHCFFEFYKEFNIKK